MHGLVFTARSRACRGESPFGIVAQRGLLVLVLTLTWAMALHADAADVGEAEPLHCWWRTSTSAVRIGEVFTALG